MARGKYLSFEEARKMGALKQFAKEHPSQADGPRFRRLLDVMTRGLLEGEQTSNQGSSGGYSGTQTLQDTSEDAS